MYTYDSLTTLITLTVGLNRLSMHHATKTVRSWPEVCFALLGLSRFSVCNVYVTVFTSIVLCATPAAIMSLASF